MCCRPTPKQPITNNAPQHKLQRDTVREFSEYLLAGNRVILETAYLKERIFDSLVSPSRETRVYYFNTSVIALNVEIQYDPIFAKNILTNINENPKEFILMLNKYDSEIIRSVGVSLGNYFHYFSKEKNPEVKAIQLKNILKAKSETLDSTSVITVELMSKPMIILASK